MTLTNCSSFIICQIPTFLGKQRQFANLQKVGNLTHFFSGYFDIEIGTKQAVESYLAIASAIAKLPDLFISDVTAELKAARAAGMQTLFSLQSGNHATDAEEFPTIESFDSIEF